MAWDSDKPSANSPMPSSDPITNLVRRLIDEYGAPFGQDSDSFKRKIAEWREILKGWQTDQLERAGTKWIRTERTWPRAADIRELLHEECRGDRRPTHRSEPRITLSAAAEDRSRRRIAILDRYKKSGDPYPHSSAILDPEYIAIEDEAGLPRASESMPDWWWKQVDAA